MSNVRKHRRPRSRATFPIDPELLQRLSQGLAPAIEARAPRLQTARTNLDLLGYSAEITCEACPLQIEGTLPNGERFYFRARWDRASLEIGSREDPDSHALFDHPERTWRRSVADWTAPEASWLDPPEAVRLLMEWVRDFRQGAPGDPHLWQPEADLRRVLHEVQRKGAVFVTDDRRLQHLGAVDTATFLRNLEKEQGATQKDGDAPAGPGDSA